MKKLLILSMLSMYVCPIPTRVYFSGLYLLNLGVIEYTTGDYDPVVDVATAVTASMLITAPLCFPPKTANECYFNMGMRVAAGGLMLGRIWYKIANRPAPASVVPMSENVLG